METGSPYTPPKDNRGYPSAAEVAGKMKFWKMAIAAALILIAIPPALCVISIFISILREIAESGNQGIGDPTALAASIGEAIIALAASLVFSLPGLVFFIVALIRFRSNRTDYRALTA